MNAILTRLATLLNDCQHDGPVTPVQTLRGAEIWRCESCGHDVVYVDELAPLPPPAKSER